MRWPRHWGQRPGGDGLRCLVKTNPQFRQWAGFILRESPWVFMRWVRCSAVSEVSKSSMPANSLAERVCPAKRTAMLCLKVGGTWPSPWSRLLGLAPRLYWRAAPVGQERPRPSIRLRAVDAHSGLARPRTENNPRHEPHRLPLLPPGPDGVHDRSSRGVRHEYRTREKNPNNKPSAGISAPHKRISGGKEPLTPHLARPGSKIFF